MMSEVVVEVFAGAARTAFLKGLDAVEPLLPATFWQEYLQPPHLFSTQTSSDMHLPFTEHGEILQVYSYPPPGQAVFSVPPAAVVPFSGAPTTRRLCWPYTTPATAEIHISNSNPAERAIFSCKTEKRVVE
jgi:hypothetical protein